MLIVWRNTMYGKHWTLNETSLHVIARKAHLALVTNSSLPTLERAHRLVFRRVATEPELAGRQLMQCVSNCGVFFLDW